MWLFADGLDILELHLKFTFLQECQRGIVMAGRAQDRDINVRKMKWKRKSPTKVLIWAENTEQNSKIFKGQSWDVTIFGGSKGGWWEMSGLFFLDDVNND